MNRPDVERIKDVLQRSAVTSSTAQGQDAGASWLFMRYLNRAAQMAETGYATSSDIDNAMRGACRLIKGPCELADAIGGQNVRQRSHALNASLVPAQREPTAGNTATTETRDTTSKRLCAVGIVGSGTMATGVAETFARAGVTVRLSARGSDSADRASSTLASSIGKARLAVDERAQLLNLLHVEVGLGHLQDCGLIIECSSEDLEKKSAMFAQLDKACGPHAVLASTTSSLRISTLAAQTTRPNRVVGMHFFNPAPVMPMVEVVTTRITEPKVVAFVRAAAEALGKETVLCGDRPGFIVNRLLIPYVNDALRVVSQGLAPDRLDATMREIFGFPMGPIDLLELIGLDIALAIQTTLHGAFPQDDLVPNPYMTALVRAGYLGRKTGDSIRPHLASPPALAGATPEQRSNLSILGR